jgi:cell division protein FtsL
MQRVLKSNQVSSFKLQVIWVVLLWMLVVVSAISTVYAVHETRNKFSELEMLRVTQNSLQVEWGKYLLEESVYASYGRIEKMATEKLAMKIPEVKYIVVVNAHD